MNLSSFFSITEVVVQHVSQTSLKVSCNVQVLSVRRLHFSNPEVGSSGGHECDPVSCMWCVCCAFKCLNQGCERGERSPAECFCSSGPLCPDSRCRCGSEAPTLWFPFRETPRMHWGQRPLDRKHRTHRRVESLLHVIHASKCTDKKVNHVGLNKNITYTVTQCVGHLGVTPTYTKLNVPVDSNNKRPTLRWLLSHCVLSQVCLTTGRKAQVSFQLPFIGSAPFTLRIIKENKIKISLYFKG